MRRSSSTAFMAAGLILALGHAGSAADLPRKPAPAYIPPAPPPYVWTGCYIGANIGAGWTNIEATNVVTGATVSPNNSGFVGGGQIGCDYQFSQWVIGFRNVFDGTSLNKSVAFTDPAAGFTGTANSHTNWFDALTARAGYLIQPNLLLYAQGGAAWTSANVKFINSAGTQVGEISRNSDTGWTVGGGIEWQFIPHWSTFVEYNFMGFGTNSATFQACGGNCLVSAKANIQNVLVGLNYRF